jgi:hypothetical protein
VKCDAEALTQRGRAQLDAGQLAASLASYEAAQACSPAPPRAFRALTLACSLRNVTKARIYWKQLAPAVRNQAMGMCVRNGIAIPALNAP